MKKQMLIAVAALVAAPVVAAPAEPFSGPFVGLQGGWQQDREQVRIDDAGSSARFNARKAGFAYGGQLGYDYKLSPRVVLGIEASATGRTGHDDIVDGTDDYQLKLGRTLGASARLGYLVSPTGLLYARGGYANTRFKLDDGVDKAATNRGGYVAGVGYEQSLTKTVSARVEYDYSNFGHNRFADLADAADVDGVSARYKRNTVNAGVNFRF